MCAMTRLDPAVHDENGESQRRVGTDVLQLGFDLTRSVGKQFARLEEAKVKDRKHGDDDHTEAGTDAQTSQAGSLETKGLPQDGEHPEGGKAELRYLTHARDDRHGRVSGKGHEV